MADVDFDEFDDGYGAAEGQAAARAARVSHLVNLAGAACSVALVVGLGIWGYKLAVRDVTGIPVIRALDGPMRIAPANPGGEVAAHQGLAVNDVAAFGTAAPSPETLILAPRPVELTDDDAAVEDLNGAAPAVPQPVAPLAAVVAPVAPLAAADPVPPLVADGDVGGPDPDAVAAALAEALATDPAAMGTDEMPVEDMAGLDANPELSEAVRPRARPAALAASGAAIAAPATTPATAPALADAPADAPVAEVAASVIPVGTRLVQLGAFDTEDQARAEWVKLSNQFSPTFAGKALVVQSAESGGRVFFRLRAHGFADEAEARSFCLTLLEQNAACIPVEQR